jgi:hypothetical protein
MPVILRVEDACEADNKPSSRAHLPQHRTPVFGWISRVLLREIDGSRGEVWVVPEDDRRSVGMFVRVCSKDDPRRKLAFSKPIEQALFDLPLEDKEN